MKKNLFMVAAVALMALVSCNKEEINGGEPQVQQPSYYVEFTASLEDDATKTSYAADLKKTKWSEGDEIAVNGKKFKVTELYEDGFSARFINIEELGENFGEPYTAVYPYNANENTTVIPAEQTVVDGSFAEEAVAAVAYSAEGNTLSFKNICSVIMFQVATSGVTELEFASNAALAGTINVNVNNGADPTYTVASASNTIKVKPSGTSFDTKATYYVSVLPTLGAEGTKQTFEIKSEGVVVKSGNVTFKRSKVMNAKSIEVKYTYLKPNLIWGISDARYAAYFFEGDANTWVSMNDADKDGVYRAVIPEGFTNLIYCRMNPANQTNDWDVKNKWNQSPDLKVPTTDNRAYVSGIMKWDGSGSWNTLAYAKSYRENAVYLKPNSNWKQSNAWFAVYLCNGSKNATWLKMTSVDGTFYGVELPNDFSAANYKNIIFARMDSGKTTLDWGSKWNQSGDLACTMMTNSPYNRCCAITNGQWDCGSNVTWTTTLK